MLTAIRDKVSGWIAVVIVSLLIVSFGLWGVSYYFTQGGAINIAKVNDKTISLQAYQRALFNLRQRMQQLFGDKLTASEDELIKEQTLGKIIDTEVINQVIENENLQVSDNSVRAAIENLELFQNEETGFDRSLYARSVLSLGMEPAYFEYQMQLDMLSEQLQSALAESTFVLDKEIEHIIGLKNQKRNITYTILSADSYMEEVVVSSEDIESYYKEHPQLYKEPEKVKIAYIDLDVSKLAETVQFEEVDLRAYYDANRDKFNVQEQRGVTQLFAKVDEDASDEEVEKVKARIDEIASIVKEGKTFEEVVELYDEEGKGGVEFSEHGLITQGIMGDEIDKFLFSANEGDISDPIKSKDGFHIVKTGVIKGGPKNTFENVKQQVEAEYKRTQAENQFFEQADFIAALTYEHPDTLEPAAEATGIDIQETGFFSRNGEQEGILAEDKILAASFNDEVKNTGNNSEAIELSDVRIVVLRVIEQLPEHLKSLADVSEEVIKDIKTSQTQQKAQELGEEILDKLTTGEELSAIAEQYNVEWTEEENIKRDDMNVNRSILRTVFRMGKPEDDSAVYKGVKMGSGDFAVIIVSNVIDASDAEIDEEMRKTTRNELIQRYANNEWKQFVNDAKNNADVNIFRDNL